MAKAETGKGKVIYTARTRATGGRDHGIARSSDGQLDVKLATPGSTRIGTNPEQLFAAAWSACFECSIALAAHKSGVTLGEVTIDAEVDLHLADSIDYFLSARLNIGIPGIDRTVAQDLVRQAEQLCPYSKATRGNIDVTLNLNRAAQEPSRSPSEAADALVETLQAIGLKRAAGSSAPLSDAVGYARTAK